MSSQGDGLRLTELLASLSLATDLGTGQPMGHGLRTSLLAVALARTMGLGDDRVRSVQQVSLLRFVGCTSDAFETARIAGGDDLAFNASMGPFLNGNLSAMLAGTFRSVGPGDSALTRASLTLASVRGAKEGLAAHCEVATMLARRLGLEDRVAAALQAAYERWDGKGLPAGLKGEEIPIEMRIASLARDVDVFARMGSDVDQMLTDRRDKGHDPAVVDAFRDATIELPEAEWEAVLDAEPHPSALVSDIDAALSVMGEFADLKSPWTRGHSGRVADLAHGAALEAGMAASDAATLKRAGLVHDIGRVGIENGIWDKPSPLSTDEWERVRTHSYLTQRVLARCPELASLGLLASSHHERLDGSGYHRQSIGDHLPIEARVLAAADVMGALTASRPHREAMDLDSASAEMRAQVSDGTLDSRAVECVIAASGGQAGTGRANPGGLTDREIEVLRLISRELTNRDVAEELFISPKTVGRHVENIYTKIGVSTRAGAAIYAMEHRLLD